jgi:hypothetical protein
MGRPVAYIPWKDQMLLSSGIRPDAYILWEDQMLLSNKKGQRIMSSGRAK